MFLLINNKINDTTDEKAFVINIFKKYKNTKILYSQMCALYETSNSSSNINDKL